MLEDNPQITSGVRLSVVQGFMARNFRSELTQSKLKSYKLYKGYLINICKFFRLYGTWVARNPILVLCSSLAVVILLGLGLIRFKVETRPEKVCTKSRFSIDINVMLFEKNS